MSAVRAALALCALTGLAACDQGTVTVSVTDAPVDGAAAVVVEFDGVEVERSTGERELFEIAPARRIDLVALADGDATVLLDRAELEEGTYNAVRLAINATGNGADSWVEDGAGARRGLRLEAANAGRLRVAGTFEIEPGEDVALTVDWDLRKSVRQPDSGTTTYDLVPSLRLIRDDDAGTLTGDVSATRAGAAGCTPAVYLYRGRDVAADDEGSGRSPFASTVVRQSGSAYRYTIGFLPAGDYTAAFTCEAGADDPETDDDVEFAVAANVALESGVSTEQDF